METGSEVYMSELLAGFDMEDFDEAEEQNEEDLIELGDSFGSINLRVRLLLSYLIIIESYSRYIKWVYKIR